MTTDANNPSAGSTRKTLGLGIQGVTTRDELLLKSLVRLLSHRTRHHWVFESENVQLRIVGDHPMAPATLPVSASNMSAEILWVGHSDQYRAPFLHLPAHANELENLLNTLGDNILKNRDCGASATSMAQLRDETFRLTQWPPAALIKTPARIKLATLMTGQPISVDKLATRSGCAVQECELFCEELKRAGILNCKAVNQAANQTSGHSIGSNQPPYLQPRINGPIGYQTDSGTGTDDGKARPELSLLSRIRRRLGLHA